MEIIYNFLKSLKPHFFSLREIKDNVSLDIKIPVKWRYENMLTLKEEVPFAVTIQDKKTENMLISLISPATVEGYDFVFSYAKAIISLNIEEEEKHKLFNEKMGELKDLFLNSPLDKLKDISFKDYGAEKLPTPSGNGEIGLGGEEGPGKDGQD